jgi:hypothetical protein
MSLHKVDFRAILHLEYMEPKIETAKKRRRRIRSSDLHQQPLIRLQVEVLVANLPRYGKAMAKAGLRTKREFFDYAITIVDWMIEETRAGRTVGYWRRDGVFVPLCSPALESARAIAQMEQGEPVEWSHWQI